MGRRAAVERGVGPRHVLRREVGSAMVRVARLGWLYMDRRHALVGGDRLLDVDLRESSPLASP